MNKVWEVRGQVVTSPERIARTRWERDVTLLEFWDEEQERRRRRKPVDKKKQALISWGNDDRNCI